MKFLLFVIPAAALCAGVAFGQNPPAANRTAPAGLTVTSRSVSDRVVENLMSAYDAGDSYFGAKGLRSLRRLAGAVAIRVENRAALNAVTANGGALEGYERTVESKGGFAWFKGGAAEREAQARNPAAHRAKIGEVRKSAAVRTANPVFIDPESGLWAITTDQIIVALRPGVDAQAYFGAGWANARPLFAPLGQYVLTLPSAESEAVFAEVNRRAADPRVAWAEPNFISQGLTHLVPNDPEFSNQWALRNSGQTGGAASADIKTTAAWDRTTGSSSVTVAVLDVGFDLSHPDLIANLGTNAQEIAGNGVDDDNNGLVDDVRGWDYFDGDNNPSPDTAFDNHGTPVVGAAVAAGNNGLGVVGVAYSCRWLPLRIGESTTETSFSSRDSDIASALYYAAGGFSSSDAWRGADVIVMSFESFQAAVVDSALTYATEQGRGGRGCPTFVAVGNHGDGWRTINLTGLSAGLHSFEWKYAKNGSGVAGEDATWLAQVIFPGGMVERFDGGTFPPPGWSTSGNASWTRSSDASHAYGPSPLVCRSGVIGNNQSSSLSTTQNLAAGNVTYTFWVSSEQDADIFSLTYNGSLIAGANRSGVPFIRSGPSYPATHPNVISIGASTHWDTRASYSQIGGKIDFVAPGGGGGGASILTTDRVGTAGDNTAASPGGDYVSTQGTSLANPIAAGVGALMLSVAPNLTATQVRDILRSTTDKIGPVPYTNGWNSFYGTGRLNASNAVAQAWAANCLGVPLLVTSLADSGPGTLREALQRVQASGCSGAISLAVTGVLQVASPLGFVDHGVTLTGPGTNHLTIDGGGTNWLFRFGGSVTNRLSGLRLANAYSTVPGASVWTRSYTVIENCVFSNSVTLGAFGGAVANSSGDPSDDTGLGALLVTNCIFVNNTARGGPGEHRGAGRNGGPGGGGAGLGGGVYSDGPILSLHGCAFVGNTAAGGNGGNGDGNSFSNDTGGNGGSPNPGAGGAIGQAGGAGGFGGGGGGGAGSASAGFAGGQGGFGAGGGGGGARGGGGDGGVGGHAGQYGGAGGVAFASHSGGGGGGAGLGGALFVDWAHSLSLFPPPSFSLVNCFFGGNRATNGIGGVGSFGGGNGGSGQGAGGAIFNQGATLFAQNLTFTGNSASTASPDVEASTLVTTLDDDGAGSLRQAIANAAIRPGSDIITFAANLSGGVIQLTSAQLVVNDASGPVTITASNLPGRLSLDGAGARRLFYVSRGTTLTLESLTLVNGNSASQGTQDGGAVFSDGNLVLLRCVLRSNTAPSRDGGAVFSNFGTMMAEGCTFNDNASGWNGGGISSFGSLTVFNSTFQANRSSNAFGGAIAAVGTTLLRHCTIVSNSAAQGGGFETSENQSTLSHCIIAGNLAAARPDILQLGAQLLGSFNFIGSGENISLTNGMNGNRVGTTNARLDPQLTSLQNYGGPTPTMHPLPGSPVVDAGDPAFSAGLTDQRGWPRVWAGRVDIGAVEFVPAAGHSVAFDGVNDFLILSNAASSLPTNEITVEFWERVETVRDQFSFILFPDMPGDRLAFSSVRIGLGTYWDYGDLFNGGRVVYGTPSGTINQWTHWALVSTRAGNAMRVYRNGVLDASSATNRSFVRYAAALVLGARLDAGGPEFFKGEIDEFRIWSVARMPSEIQATMSTGLRSSQTNLWLYWKFNESGGATVLDHSGNGRDGLLFNGASRALSLAPLFAPGVPSLVRISPTEASVTWTPDSGSLESAPDVSGIWTNVPGATNGQVILTTPARQFFRVTQ